MSRTTNPSPAVRRLVALVAACVALALPTRPAAGEPDAAAATLPATRPATAPATRPSPLAFARERLESALDDALARPGWTALPPPIRAVRYAGPVAGTPAGESPAGPWYLTTTITGNSRPDADAGQERAFVESVEAAHAGRTRVIVGGEVALVDPAGRIWCVAEHLPHLLRCYDGDRWTHRRADGLPAADDEPAAFIARVRAEGRYESRYAAGGLRDLNDLGRWWPAACADAAGNLHFVGGCESDDAERRGAGGFGVHTLAPDGTWSLFRILPPDAEVQVHALDGVRFVPLDPDAGADLVTLASLELSDADAAALGLGVEPPPEPDDKLRAQQWEPHADGPRHGPVFLFRFGPAGWRAERSAVGWGVYDNVYAAWPQPDGRAYLANRFGLWEQWPEGAGRARADRLIESLIAAGNDPDRARVAADLAAVGRHAVGPLRAAVDRTASPATRGELSAALLAAEAVVRGEEAAVPVIGGRWRFAGAYPQATMPDGRFAFHCDEATDVRTGAATRDCIVFFDPAGGTFHPVPIDHAQWDTTDFSDKRRGEPPVNGGHGVIDRDGALWVPEGYRMTRDGKLDRVVPPGLTVGTPSLVDGDGRVYARNDAPNSLQLLAYNPARGGAAAEAATRPAAEPERQFPLVRAVFSQPDLPPPWNGWAVVAGGERDELLRLDGPEPTVVPLPPAMPRASAVAPLEGGCVAAYPGAAGYWTPGGGWDVADDVRALVERHGPAIAAAVPTRAFAGSTSLMSVDGSAEFELMIASDGAGGLWVADDSAVDPDDEPRMFAGGRLHPAPGNRKLWHWTPTPADGEPAFADVWSAVALGPSRTQDGAFATRDGGRGLVIRVIPTEAAPGAVWTVWRSGDGGPPRLRPSLEMALGPRYMFDAALWVDRDGWLWSPVFDEGSPHRRDMMARRFGPKVGLTGVSKYAASLAQGEGDRIWYVSGRMRDRAMVWADVSGPTTDVPSTYAREAWVGGAVAGMGPASVVAVAPDGRAWLLHEGGLSLVDVATAAEGDPLPMPTHLVRSGRRPATQPTSRPGDAGDAEAGPATRPVVVELARRPWPHPRNSFGDVAFDATGVWFRPADGPLIRVPMPTPDADPPPPDPRGPAR